MHRSGRSLSFGVDSSLIKGNVEAVPIQEAEKLACPSVPVRDQSSGSRGEIRKDGDDGRSAGEELGQVVSNFARQQEAGG